MNPSLRRLAIAALALLPACHFAKTGAYSVEVVGSGDKKPVNLVLPQALLDAVRRDASRWRAAR